MKSNPKEKDFKVLVDKKLNVHPAMRPGSPEGQLSPGLHPQQVEGGAPLLCSGETPPESCIQLWSPQHRRDMDLLEQGQKRPQQ